MNAKIIYENEHFIVVNKPSGLVVHGDGRTQEDTLVDWLNELFLGRGGLDSTQAQKNIGRPHTLDSGRYVDRWGIVNRLDRDTSGLILVAKSEKDFDNLQKLFLEKKITKKYTALLWGEIDEDEIKKLLKENFFKKTITSNKYLIDEGITRHKKDPRIWVLVSEENSRQSVRAAQTLVEFGKICEVSGKKFTFVNFFPLTGRTHQLRLHAKYLGHPILGDKKYGYGGLDSCTDDDKKNRLHLHAESLEFELEGEKYQFIVPADF
jgi:23S rRNA pseudouridine1911/1915/1917 synthase